MALGGAEIGGGALETEAAAAAEEIAAEAAATAEEIAAEAVATAEEIAAEVPDIVEMTDTRLSGRCPLKAQEWDTGGRGRGSRRRRGADPDGGAERSPS